jgi:hypothetical protein
MCWNHCNLKCHNKWDSSFTWVKYNNVKMFAVHCPLSAGEIIFTAFWKLSVPSSRQQGGKSTQLGLFNITSPCYWANNTFPSSLLSYNYIKNWSLGGKLAGPLCNCKNKCYTDIHHSSIWANHMFNHFRVRWLAAVVKLTVHVEHFLKIPKNALGCINVTL